MGTMKKVIIALALVVAAGVLAVVGQVYVIRWNQPKIEYQENLWYDSDQRAIKSLSLWNRGPKDAVRIRIDARFQEPLLEIKTSDAGLPFKLLDGGLGKKSVHGYIDRLTPGDSITIWFSIENDPDISHHFSVVQFLVFNGGTAKRVFANHKHPMGLEHLLALIVGSLMGLALVFGMVQFWERRDERKYGPVAAHMARSVVLGAKLALQGTDDFDKEWEEQFGSEYSGEYARYCRAGKDAFEQVKKIRMDE